ncbi:MAG: pyridoxal 5'-phosphate synthase glutaminase subunit PdxT [candidate division Zixibacteria bacterium]|nr:pyridoxal 5'-phosphate synthase glutaminase subunit PdxT [candidate division Zixibacteria bacterium]
MTIGLLTLQGDFERHRHQLELLGAGSRDVRLPSDLESLDGLIIPGGESTTMSILMDRFDLRRPLLAFARRHPVYGTCAGMIMLAKNIENNISGVKPLGLLDIDVDRNGYGRQIYSFEDELEVHLNGLPKKIKAAFIRAPRITRLGKGVQVLADYRKEPVFVRQNNILASSFHTELGDDMTVIKYFADNFFS